MLYPVAHALRCSHAAERMISFDEFNTLIGLDPIIAAEAKYEPR